MPTEGGEKVGLKRKSTGPQSRPLLAGKTRANRRGEAAGGGRGQEEGRASGGAQEEVVEEQQDVQATRGRCSPDQEGGKEEQEGRGTRKSWKGVWRRLVLPAFACFRRRRRRPLRLDTGTPGCVPPAGRSSATSKRKRRFFPALSWPLPLIHHLLTPGRERRWGGAEGAGPAEDDPEIHQTLNGSLTAVGKLRDAREPIVGRDSGSDKPEGAGTPQEEGHSKQDDGSVACSSGGRVLEHRSESDLVVMEMSVQEPEPGNEDEDESESQGGCYSDPPPTQGLCLLLQVPGDEELMDGASGDPAKSHFLPPPSAAHNDLISIAMVTAGDEASPARGPVASEEEEEEAGEEGEGKKEEREEEATTATGLSNGGAGVVATVTDTPLVFVVPIVCLNSSREDPACNWGDGPLGGGAWAEVDGEWKAGGGGGEGGGHAEGEAELELSAQEVVRAAIFAAVQQLLREQLNSVEHAHHHPYPTLNLPTFDP